MKIQRRSVSLIAVGAIIGVLNVGMHVVTNAMYSWLPDTSPRASSFWYIPPENRLLVAGLLVFGLTTIALAMYTAGRKPAH